MVDEKTITTDVDKLISILKRKKEVSLENAASIVGLPIATIESWSRFLEEEGLITIKYKLTTPYLVLNDNNDARKKIAELGLLGQKKKQTEYDDSFSRIDFMYKKAKETIDDKQFDMTESQYSDIVDQLFDIYSKFIEENPGYKGTKIDRQIIDLDDKARDHLIRLQKALTKGESSEVASLMKTMNDTIERFHSLLIDFINNPPTISKEEKKKQKEADSIGSLTEEELDKLLVPDKEEEPEEEVPKDEPLKLEDSESEEDAIDDKLKKQIDRGDDISSKLKGLAYSVSMKRKDKNKDLSWLKDIRQMLKEAYDAMKRGDFETAKKIYNEIHEIYTELPKLFDMNKKEIENSLLSLNKDLTVSLGKLNEKQIMSCKKQIESHLTKAGYLMEKGDMDGAFKYYNRADDKFKKMPEGMLRVRAELEEKLVLLYTGLMKQNDHALRDKTRKDYVRIKGLLSKAKHELEAAHIDTVKSTYVDIATIYKTIPDHYFAMKSELEDMILSLRKEIIRKEYKLKEHEFKTKSEVIDNLMLSTEKILQQGNIAEARNNYNRLDRLFNTLPFGFLDLKTVIEERKLKLQRNIQRKINLQKLSVFEKIRDKVSALFDSVEQYNKKGNFELAREIYTELIFYFNKISIDFIDYRNDMLPKILNLYKTIIISLDSHVVDKLSDDLKNKYDIMLKLIIKCKRDMHDFNIELLKINYSHLVMYYKQFPLWFLEEKTSIRNEIMMIDKVVRLYDDSKSLQKDVYSGKVSKEQLKEIEGIFNNLLESYPESSTFLIRLNKMIDPSLKLLKQASISTPVTAMPSGGTLLQSHVPNHGSDLFEKKEKIQNDLSKGISVPEPRPVPKVPVSIVQKKKINKDPVRKKEKSTGKSQKQRVSVSEDNEYRSEWSKEDIKSVLIDKKKKLLDSYLDRNDYLSAVRQIKSIISYDPDNGYAKEKLKIIESRISSSLQKVRADIAKKYSKDDIKPDKKIEEKDKGSMPKMDEYEQPGYNHSNQDQFIHKRKQDVLDYHNLDDAKNIVLSKKRKLLDSYMASENYKKALETVRTILRYDPKDDDAKKTIEEIRSKIDAVKDNVKRDEPSQRNIVSRIIPPLDSLVENAEKTGGENNSSVEGSNPPILSDPTDLILEKKRKLLDSYLESRNFEKALNVANSILRYDPDDSRVKDQLANIKTQIYDGRNRNPDNNIINRMRSNPVFEEKGPVPKPPEWLLKTMDTKDGIDAADRLVEDKFYGRKWQRNH